ncbi:MAG: DUF2382 domain-containing protein, partial [Chloroflexota bacterium]|nr:DUF2382 domain-containing protein [Chloroflexota bacterium]
TKGAEVYDANDEKVGKVVEVGRNSFKVEKGFIFHKDMHLPMGAVARVHDHHVHLNVAKDHVMKMGAEQLPTEGHEWYGMNTREPGRTADRAGQAGEAMSVPVIEEELKAGVREKEGGTARVTKNVVAEQKSIDVPVQHEEVYVTERAVNRAATKEDLAAMDRDIEIPLRQQEVVTSKEAVVTGEVNIRKETVRDTERVTDTVRREEVHVEDPNNKRVHVEGERGMRGQAGTGGGKTVTDTRQYDAQGNLVDEKVTEKPNR